MRGKKLFNPLSLITFPRRYEVESDENREAMVIEIGRRYLGVEEEIKDHDEKSEKTDLDTSNQNNVSPKRNQSNEKGEGQSLNESDLVIDILNDELVSLVKLKIRRNKSPLITLVRVAFNQVYGVYL